MPNGRGRPPTPNEIKRRRGTLPVRKNEEESKVVLLPAAGGPPPTPDELDTAGRALWQQCWHYGLPWIHPVTDVAAVIRACMLADDLALARLAYRANAQPMYGRLVVNISHELGSALASLGFDPSARTKLGVAEVQAQSKLEQLARRRQENG